MDIVTLSRKAKEAYMLKTDEDQETLRLQAEATSNRTVYLSKKQISKQGRKIFERMRNDVSYCIYYAAQ